MVHNTCICQSDVKMAHARLHLLNPPQSICKAPIAMLHRHDAATSVGVESNMLQCSGIFSHENRHVKHVHFLLCAAEHRLMHL